MDWLLNLPGTMVAKTTGNRDVTAGRECAPRRGRWFLSEPDVIPYMLPWPILYRMAVRDKYAGIKKQYIVTVFGIRPVTESANRSKPYY